jgi:ring-1,2-phenylacetyl-CoA epoxidase subunit PaaD
VVSALSAARAWAALAAVPDPELPPVSIVELGMVAAVRVEGGRVEVDLVPTFSGCPAIEMIEADVESAVAGLDGVEGVQVRWVHEPVWSAARITDEGRAKLAAWDVGVDSGGADCAACPRCAGTRTTRTSRFGPTPCRSIHHCADCRDPFEIVRD